MTAAMRGRRTLALTSQAARRMSRAAARRTTRTQASRATLIVLPIHPLLDLRPRWPLPRSPPLGAELLGSRTSCRSRPSRHLLLVRCHPRLCPPAKLQSHRSRRSPPPLPRRARNRHRPLRLHRLRRLPLHHQLRRLCPPQPSSPHGPSAVFFRLLSAVARAAPRARLHQPFLAPRLRPRTPRPRRRPGHSRAPLPRLRSRTPRPRRRPGHSRAPLPRLQPRTPRPRRRPGHSRAPLPSERVQPRLLHRPKLRPLLLPIRRRSCLQSSRQPPHRPGCLHRAGRSRPRLHRHPPHPLRRQTCRSLHTSASLQGSRGLQNARRLRWLQLQTKTTTKMAVAGVRQR